jgi:hypothetical protein
LEIVILNLVLHLSLQKFFRKLLERSANLLLKKIGCNVFESSQSDKKIETRFERNENPQTHECLAQPYPSLLGK